MNRKPWCHMQMLNFDYSLCLVNLSGSCLSKANRWHHLFLALMGLFYSLHCNSSEAALPIPYLSLYLFYCISVYVYYASPVFLLIKTEEKKGSKNPTLHTTVASSQEFQLCLLLMISWHGSELYKKQIISPEACGIIHPKSGSSSTTDFDMLINHLVRNLCY